MYVSETKAEEILQFLHREKATGFELAIDQHLLDAFVRVIDVVDETSAAWTRLRVGTFFSSDKTWPLLRTICHKSTYRYTSTNNTPLRSNRSNSKHISRHCRPRLLWVNNTATVGRR